jgi:hypothetical protein
MPTIRFGSGSCRGSLASARRRSAGPSFDAQPAQRTFSVSRVISSLVIFIMPNIASPAAFCQIETAAERG